MTTEYDEVVAELERLGAPRLAAIANDEALRQAIQRARELNVPYKVITEHTGYERDAAYLICNPDQTRKARRARAETGE